jgi:sec-independent protein translocase protein TatC
MPLIAYYLAKAGIINHRLLSAKRRYAILGIFVVSAVITPPELTSQLLFVIPLIGLYEVSIIIARIFGKKKKPEGDTEEKPEDKAEDKTEGKPEDKTGESTDVSA